MNDAIEALGISTGVAIVFGIPFAFFAFVRYLRYKETIALAQRGLLRPERMRNGRDTLRWGIVITMLGMGLMCGSLTIGFYERAPLGIGPWMMLGILPFFFGVALLIIYYVSKQEDREERAAEETDPVPLHKSGNME